MNFDLGAKPDQCHLISTAFLVHSSPFSTIFSVVFVFFSKFAPEVVAPMVFCFSFVSFVRPVVLRSSTCDRDA